MIVEDALVRGLDLVQETDSPRHIIHIDIETRTIQYVK